jgi:hypothetical protein
MMRTSITLVVSLTLGVVLLAPALSLEPGAKPKEIRTPAPPPPAAESTGIPDLDAIEQAMQRQIAPLSEQVKKLSADIEGLTKELRTRQGPKGEPKPSSEPGAPAWQYWSLLLVGSSILGLLLLQLASARKARRETAAAGAPQRGNTPSSVATRPIEPAYKNFETDLKRQSADVAELRREIGDLKRASNRRAEAPLAQPVPSRRDEPLPASNDWGDVLRDFNLMAGDPTNSTIEAFVKKWAPKEVTMINFDQRVAESAHRPELRMSDGKGGDVHFWFFGPNSSWTSAEGYLLPAKSLFRYQSALGEDATVKVMRTIFDVVRADSFKIERAAQARTSGSTVTVHIPGTLALPRLR